MSYRVIVGFLSVTCVLFAVGCPEIPNLSIPDGIWRDDPNDGGVGFEFETRNGTVVFFSYPGLFAVEYSPGVTIGIDGRFADGERGDFYFEGVWIEGSIQALSASGQVGYKCSGIPSFGTGGIPLSCSSTTRSWNATYQGPAQ